MFVLERKLLGEGCFLQVRYLIYLFVQCVFVARGLRVPGLALGAGNTELTQARARHGAAWHQHALLGKGRRQEVNRGPGRLVAPRGDRPSSAAATPASPGGPPTRSLPSESPGSSHYPQAAGNASCYTRSLPSIHLSVWRIYKDLCH